MEQRRENSWKVCVSSISFPEPTCLLVSTKTRSCGQNNQDFRTSGFTADACLGLNSVQRRSRCGCVPQSIRAGKTRKVEIWFEIKVVSKFKSKRHVGSGNELVDYSRAPCLDADQKTRGLWEGDCCEFIPSLLSENRL